MWNNNVLLRKSWKTPRVCSNAPSMAIFSFHNSTMRHSATIVLRRFALHVFVRAHKFKLLIEIWWIVNLTKCAFGIKCFREVRRWFCLWQFYEEQSTICLRKWTKQMNKTTNANEILKYISESKSYNFLHVQKWTKMFIRYLWWTTIFL